MEAQGWFFCLAEHFPRGPDSRNDVSDFVRFEIVFEVIETRRLCFFGNCWLLVKEYPHISGLTKTRPRSGCRILALCPWPETHRGRRVSNGSLARQLQTLEQVIYTDLTHF